jgi:hypothetical protein
MMLFGTSEVAVRLLSALFGVLAIPMIYLVGRELFNEEAGLVGALILALSSFNIYSTSTTRKRRGTPASNRLGDKIREMQSDVGGHARV